MKRFHVGPVLILPVALALGGCDLIFPPDPPGPPTSLGAEPLSRTEVDLGWDAPTAGGELEEFELERAAGGSAFETVETLESGLTSFTDTGLESETLYSYRLRSCNAGGCSAYTSEAEAETFGVPEVTTDSLPDATVGQPYTVGLDATGAGSDYTWAIASGALPAGLALGDTTGVIAGTPSATDTAQITVEATAVDGQTATASFTLRVLSAPPIAISTAALPPVIAGGDYEVHISASGGGTERSWSLAQGTLPAGISLVSTDSTGILQGTPTTPDTASITVRVVSVGDTADKDFDLPVIPHDTTTFNVTPMDVSGVPDSIQPHVDSALVWWERVLTGNVQAGFIPAGTFEAGDCGGFGDAVNGTTLDDVIVIVNIDSIDGAGGSGGNILGQAAPCAIRGDQSDDPNIPGFGILTLDEFDLAQIVGTETLTALIFHEIGHVLGYGSLWNHLGLISGSGTSTPTFTGTAAVTEYQDLGGSGNVPLENDGGQGTAEVHWEEDDFDREIMTGFSEPVGVDQPLSRVTIASMEDLGYEADRSQADSFTLSALLMAGAHGHHLGHDRVLPIPILVIDPDGTVRPAPIR